MKKLLASILLIITGISSSLAEENIQKIERARIDEIIKEAYIQAGTNENYEEKIEEVLEILNQNKENFTTGDTLYKNLIKNYDGGQWIEYDKEGNPYPVIAIVDRYQSDQILKNKISNKAVVIYVEYSISELEAINEEIYPLFAEVGSTLNGLIQSIGVDPRINRVSIDVHPENASEVFNKLRTQGIDTNKIHINPRVSTYQNIGNLYSGSGTFIQQPSQYLFCTAGFVGRVDNSYDVAITAGHCIPNIGPGNVYLLNRENAQFTRPPLSSLGEFVGSKLANEYTPNNIIKRDIGHYANANHVHNFLPIIAPPASFPIVGYTSNVSPGQMLCAFGAVSQWRCGPVLRTGLTQSDISNVTIINTTEIAMCSRGGDSGGPGVLRNGNSMTGYAIAVSIRSGPSIGGGAPLEPDSNCFNNSNNAPTNSITIFQPVVEYANRHNIILKTF